MKNHPTCYACDKEIHSVDDFRIGSIRHNNPYFKIFHKDCFRKFWTTELYVDVTERKGSGRFSRETLMKFWKFNLPMIKFWYATGIYSLNSYRFWIIGVLSLAIVLYLLRSVFESLPYTLYFMIAIYAIIFGYAVGILIYYYKKYVW